MKRLTLLLLLVLCSMVLTAQNEDWLWAKRAGGTSSDYGQGISTDANGNSYVTGYFIGSATFGGTVFTSSGNGDIFIAKIDRFGNWLWVRQAGGTGGDVSYSIAIDQSGNCYITGYFMGSASFGSTTLVSTTSLYYPRDIFIAKLDSNGNWLWARAAGGVLNDCGSGIAVDNNGNCYVTGYFAGVSSFGGHVLEAVRNSEIFIAKLDTNGNWLWAMQAGGYFDESGNDITVDSSGSCYIIGQFEGIATFGSISFTSYGDKDAFVIKLDTNGNWGWVKQIGGTGYDIGYSITSDLTNNCYVSGCFSSTASFGSNSLISSGSQDVFVAKLSSSGNWIWLRKAGGTSQDVCHGIASDSNGNCYLAGQFQLTAEFGSHSVSSNGSDDIFVAKLDTNGNWLWVNEAGGIEEDYCSDIAVDVDDNCYVSGYYRNIATLGWLTLSSSGIDDIFFAKLGEPHPRLSTTPELNIDFGEVFLGFSSPSIPLMIKNSGSASLVIDEISFLWPNSLFVLQQTELPILIPRGDSLLVNLVYTPQVAGSVTDSLFIHNNSPDQPIYAIQLKGRGEYVPPLPPDNVDIIMNGNDAVISWDAVTETELHTPIEPDYYLVFYNGSESPEGLFYYHGATPNLSYTHYLVGLHAANMFYRVRAYKFYGRSGVDFFSFGLVPGMTEAEVIEKLEIR